MDELALLRSTRDNTREPSTTSLAAGRAALFERIAGESAASTARMTSRETRKRAGSRRAMGRVSRVSVIALASVVVGAAATGGAVLFFATQEAQDYSVFCYSEANTASVYTQAILFPAEAAGEELERIPIDAIETCSAMWAGGVIGQNTPPKDANVRQYAIPELQACERRDKVAAVFPSEDDNICAVLGMAPLGRG